MTSGEAKPSSSVDRTGGRRIVAGTDGSPESIRALGWAAKQAELTNASLEIIAVWQWPSTFGWASIPESVDLTRDVHETLEPVLASLRDQYPHVVLSHQIVEGHPAPVLVSASKGAELLVVGNRGHGEFVGMLIGSTSAYCVANAHCPVVVVRSGD